MQGDGENWRFYLSPGCSSWCSSVAHSSGSCPVGGSIKIWSASSWVSSSVAASPVVVSTFWLWTTQLHWGALRFTRNESDLSPIGRPVSSSTLLRYVWANSYCSSYDYNEPGRWCSDSFGTSSLADPNTIFIPSVIFVAFFAKIFPLQVKLIIR